MGFSDDYLRSHERGYPALAQMTGMPVTALVFAEGAVAGDIFTDSGRHELASATVLGSTVRTLRPELTGFSAPVEEAYGRDWREAGYRECDASDEKTVAASCPEGEVALSGRGAVGTSRATHELTPIPRGPAVGRPHRRPLERDGEGDGSVRCQLVPAGHRLLRGGTARDSADGRLDGVLVGEKHLLQRPRTARLLGRVVV